MQHTPHPARPRIPISLIIGAGLLALVPMIGAVVWLWREWAALVEHYPFWADTIRLSIFLLPLVFGGWAIGTLITIAWRRYGDHRYIQAHHVTQLERARTQVAPLATSFNYHPQATPPAQLALPEPSAAPALAVPTFTTMLD